MKGIHKKIVPFCTAGYEVSQIPCESGSAEIGEDRMMSVSGCSSLANWTETHFRSIIGDC